jgi:DNA-directed RNA polymerase specialized sigma24 family protein
MNDLYESTNPWEAFKRGEPEAFQYYFLLHNYRIYCYLLRSTRDRGAARGLTENAFVVLHRQKDHLTDDEHLLRRLYLNARVAYLLWLKGTLSAAELGAELQFYPIDDEAIMDDPEVVSNETLVTLQGAMQQFPPVRRVVAELYFFSGFSAQAIAQHLGVDEKSIRELISQSLQWLDEGLAGRGTSSRNLFVVRG